MKKVLIHLVHGDFNALECAIENIEAGNEVFLLQCDNSLGICQHNELGNCMLCMHCRHAMRSITKELGINNRVKWLKLKSLITEADIKEAQSCKIDFNSIQGLKDYIYKDAELGYGAFSSYVTSTRNVMPDITDQFKKYITYMIRKEIMVYNVVERLYDAYHFDLIIFHNGRFAQFKPFYEFSRLHGIEYIATECKFVNKKLLKDNFHNDIPHSLKYLAKNVLENWERGDTMTREEIGRSFFERRKKGLAAGDKVFVKDQHIGEMPADWDDAVENISIFNSSEDEFCAISKDYDNYLMFPNQYIALKTIFDHYKNDKTKHFYVRVHPNLKNVPYKSHLALYELKYDNVTIIAANSSVSSYSLLDNSDKIIIFDSTMGVEAAYWGKPVIALSNYIYKYLGLLNYPNNTKELWDMIDDKNLGININENLIKYGYWLLNLNYPETKIPYGYVNMDFLGHKIETATIMKSFGSYKICIIEEMLLNKLKFFSSFKVLPCTNPYKP